VQNAEQPWTRGSFVFYRDWRYRVLGDAEEYLFTTTARSFELNGPRDPRTVGPSRDIGTMSIYEADACVSRATDGYRYCPKPKPPDP
jgi:hypothetical protein